MLRNTARRLERKASFAPPMRPRTRAGSTTLKLSSIARVAAARSEPGATSASRRTTGVWPVWMSAAGSSISVASTKTAGGSSPPCFRIRKQERACGQEQEQAPDAMRRPRRERGGRPPASPFSGPETTGPDLVTKAGSIWYQKPGCLLPVPPTTRLTNPEAPRSFAGVKQCGHQHRISGLLPDPGL
jgi:hypothetical protein